MTLWKVAITGILVRSSMVTAELLGLAQVTVKLIQKIAAVSSYNYFITNVHKSCFVFVITAKWFLRGLGLRGGSLLRVRVELKQTKRLSLESLEIERKYFTNAKTYSISVSSLFSAPSGSI